MPAAVEFIAYVIICTLIILPLAFVGSVIIAVGVYIALTLLVLFVAGFYRGRLMHTRPTRDGLELAFLGLLIIAIGALAGFGVSQASCQHSVKLSY